MKLAAYRLKVFYQRAWTTAIENDINVFGELKEAQYLS